MADLINQIFSKLLLLFFLSILLYSCEKEKYKSEKKDKAIVSAHCASCHQLPDPGLLDKKTWARFILPRMGAFLGIKSFKGIKYDEQKSFENSFIFPETPLISNQEWSAILRYFNTLAPEKMPSQEKKHPIKISSERFEVISANVRSVFPHTIMVAQNRENIFFGDAYKNKIYALDNQYSLIDSIRTGSAPVGLSFEGKEKFVLTMGTFNPSDSKFGNFTKIDSSKNNKIILQDLPRPIQSQFADLNNDEKTDIIICGFGFLTGAFEWHENKGERYIKHLLNPSPGAIKVVVEDFNNDKKTDLLVLMAQGNEGFDLYLNAGNGKFESPKRILTFPPSFGSNSFELIDFNKDGFKDIIATNGDNGDYPQILKNYHGVRIYLNDHYNNFKESYFYPINGIHKAIARDFDLDGDVDIATIAYFADFDNFPEESFIYLENNGKENFVFNASTIPQYDAGRWMTMEAGDIDNDGDEDIILGSCILPFYKVNKLFTEKWKKPLTPILILKNNTKIKLIAHKHNPSH